jgi:hypothetical protein
MTSFQITVETGPCWFFQFLLRTTDLPPVLSPIKKMSGLRELAGGKRRTFLQLSRVTILGTILLPRYYNCCHRSYLKY